MSELELNIKTHFGDINAEDLETISSLFEFETLKKGDCFVNYGKTCDKMSFIQSGFLRIFVETEKKEFTQWISSKGQFVTDLSGFILEKPSRWTINALTDTEIYTIYKSDYKKLEKLVPLWSVLEKVFIVRCFGFLEDRIFSHLSMSAEERYNYFFENNKELFNQVPLQYLASMLGMSPETFSRIRSKQLSKK